MIHILTIGRDCKSGEKRAKELIILHLWLKLLSIHPIFINPLVTDPLYLVCMAKIPILKKEGIIENISYEHLAYESVDDRSHSYVIS